jgi:hypothetical protein
MVAMLTSFHAMQRAAQWNVSAGEMDFIVEIAHRERSGGVIFCQLRACNIAEDIPPNHRYRQLIGTTIVLCKCGECVITLYRNVKAFRADRKKAKYNNRKQDQHNPCPICGSSAKIA